MRDEDQLLRAAVAGDRVALAEFVQTTHVHVWRFCAYLGRGHDTGDLVQDTYARMLGAIPRFEGRSPARSWLLAIARRVCADAIRGARRRRAIESSVLGSDRTQPDASGGVAIDLAVHSLTTERREAFVLTRVIGLSYAEAAAVCGVPIGTIRSRVARAREDLQLSLADQEARDFAS
jgi:RNA polymerase sigma-70 factor (ECF subfamily)